LAALASRAGRVSAKVGKLVVSPVASDQWLRSGQSGSQSAHKWPPQVRLYRQLSVGLVRVADLHPFAANWLQSSATGEQCALCSARRTLALAAHCSAREDPAQRALTILCISAHFSSLLATFGHLWAALQEPATGRGQLGAADSGWRTNSSNCNQISTAQHPPAPQTVCASALSLSATLAANEAAE